MSLQSNTNIVLATKNNNTVQHECTEIEHSQTSGLTECKA